MILTFIPDIHGKFLALERLLESSGLVRGSQWIGGPEHRLIQLGDLIDRGSRSMECVERMLNLNVAYPGQILCLLGNHEDLMLRALQGDRGAAVDWRNNGGDATVRSYGKDFRPLLDPGGRHRQWLEQLPVKLDLDGVLVCHAGLGVDNQDAQDRQALLHGRPPLVKGSWKTVVCGHNVTSSGDIEFRGGVYHTDIGLGRRAELELQFLRLNTETMDSEIIACGIF